MLGKNFDCQKCSVLGISVLKQSNPNIEENENVEEEPSGTEYALPTLFEKFDHRWDNNVSCGDINPQEFRKDMSLKEFCDKFNSKLSKLPGQEDIRLQISLRMAQKRDNSFHCPFA